MAKSAGFVNLTVKKSIETSAGTAYYQQTEIEDSLGRWNDNYYTRDGYYVIHEGRQHHVYKIGQKGKGIETKIREILGTGWSAMNISSQIAKVTNIPQSKVLQIIQDNHWDRNEIIKVLMSKKGKGWYENPDHTGKAPIHKEVATRAQAKHAQNKPMTRHQRELRLRLIHEHQYHNPETGLVDWKPKTPQHIKDLEEDIATEQIQGTQEKHFQNLIEQAEKVGVGNVNDWISRYNDPKRSKDDTILDLESLITVIKKRKPMRG